MSDTLDRLTTALADRYAIERELGAGGMATVYLAEDLKHHRKVAIKVLRPELAAVIGAERFLSEIKTTANLQHPHILPLHDSGEVNGTVFYVMPYIEGESLRERLQRDKQLSIADAVRITTEIAGALDYAHRHGVIHRDIKPENILLHDGQAMVADFGIALAASKSDGGTRMTETGMSLGTPHYMSPEQAMGERNLDARTDVYALGCVLYEMLTGEPPFNGPSAQAIVAKVMTEKPTAPSATRDTVPEVVEDAVLTALAKLPVDRFTSAADFATALAGRGATMPLTRARASATAPAPRSLVAWVGWPVAALALAAALWGWLRPIDKPTSRFAVGFPRGQALDIIPDGTHLALSRDGTALVYLGGDSTESRLWVKRRNELSAVAIPGTEGAYDPFFSPDGLQVGFFNERGGRALYRVSLSGGLPQVVYRGNLGTSGGTWATDGYIYFDADADGLQRIHSDGSGREVVMALDSAQNEIGYAWPQVMLDNTVILARLRRRSDNPEDFDIVAGRIGSKERVTIIRGVSARYLAGQLLFVTADGTLQAAPLDERRLTLAGAPVVVAAGLRVAGTYAGVNLTVSDDGTVLYVAGPASLTSHLEWVGSDGVGVPVDTAWKETVLTRGFALSPDGSHLAVSLAGTGSSGTDIWIKQLPTGPFTRLTVEPGFDRNPAWSADGKSVYFTSNRVTPEALYRRRADGLGEDSLVMQPAYDILDATESRDGRWLLATVADSTVVDIVAMEHGRDSAPRPLIASPAQEGGPAISPDGRWIAYISSNSGRPEIYVRPFPDVSGGLWQVSINGGILPRWSHSGRSLFFIEPGAGQILAADITATPTFIRGTPRVVLRPPSASGIALSAGYDISIDDRRFLVISRGAANIESQLVRIENLLEELRRRKR